MARVTLGPIVATASGKVAGTVFSSWHGRGYVRKLVTPFNPQSAAQTAQRNALARCVVLHRWLPAYLKTAQDAFAVGLRMSGYNWFVGQNVVDEKDYDAGKICGHIGPIPVVQNFAVVAGGAGEIDLTWTDPSIAAISTVNVLVRKVEPADEADRLSEVDALPVADAAYSLTGLDTGELYRVFAFYRGVIQTDLGESESGESLAG